MISFFFSLWSNLSITSYKDLKKKSWKKFQCPDAYEEIEYPDPIASRKKKNPHKYQILVKFLGSLPLVATGTIGLFSKTASVLCLIWRGWKIPTGQYLPKTLLLWECFELRIPSMTHLYITSLFFLKLRLFSGCQLEHWDS